jgi:hypothetical protein
VAKLNLSDPVNLRNEQTALGTIGANNRAIEQAVEKSLSRDGSSPNEMNSDFDMNGHRLINLPDAESATEPVPKRQVQSLVDAAAATIARGPQGPPGNATGPGSSVDGEIVLFNGATGGLLKRATGSGIVHATNGTYSVSLVVTTDITNNAVDSTKLRDSAALSVIGNSTNIPADPADIPTTNGSGAVLRESGGVLGFGTISTAGIANNVVTYAKMQDVSATSLVIGRKAAGAGDPEELTLSDVLDFIGGAAQGDILFRGTSAWQRLGKGSDTQVLTLVGGLPTWAAPTGGGGLTLITTVTAPATPTWTITGLGGFKALWFSMRNFSQASGSSRSLQVELSGNGGSTFGAIKTPLGGISIVSGATEIANFYISRCDQTNNQLIFLGTFVAEAAVSGIFPQIESGSVGPINAVRFSWGGGATTFTGGEIDVYGWK